MIERLFGEKNGKMPESAARACRVVTLTASALAGVLVACSEPLERSPIEPGLPETRVIVLDSTARAYRVLDLDSVGIPASILVVALPNGFAGSAFDARGTRAIATTGGAAGNDLYVTDVSTGTTAVVTLPQAVDDPGKARFLSEDTAFVPARGSGRVYRFVVPTSAFTALTGDVAQSPVDAVPFQGRVYVIDANADRATGATLGPSRVVVVDAGTGAAPDTVPLGGEAALGGTIAGGRLFVLQAGPSGSPGGRLAALDLAGALPVLAGELELEGLGVSVETGLDGLVYVVIAPDPAEPGVTSVLVVDPGTLAFVAGPETPLDLRVPGDAAASCRAATADSSGAIYCIGGSDGGVQYVYGPNLKGRAAISLGDGPSDLAIADIP